MPSLSGRFEPAAGPILNVAVARPGSATGTSLTHSQLTLFPALIDTGATFTCISASVAEAVKLRATGRREMNSATHSVTVNTYLADLIVPFGSTAFVISSITLAEFAAPPDAPMQILLGRDILCRGVLTFSFDGHFTFSI
jgi:predicted aspartyl protease